MNIKTLLQKGITADPNKTNDNIERDGNTSVTSPKKSRFASIDGRKLRRKDRPHQFNTKISDAIHEELYRIVIAKGITITEITEQAFKDYFEKVRLEDLKKQDSK